MRFDRLPPRIQFAAVLFVELVVIAVIAVARGAGIGEAALRGLLIPEFHTALVVLPPKIGRLYRSAVDRAGSRTLRRPNSVPLLVVNIGVAMIVFAVVMLGSLMLPVWLLQLAGFGFDGTPTRRFADVLLVLPLSATTFLLAVRLALRSRRVTRLILGLEQRLDTTPRLGRRRP